MATISVTSDLDVADKFKTLVQEALGGDSAYIRAKETIESFSDPAKYGDLAAADKAKIVGEIIGGIVNNINSSALSAAVQWSNQEKEIELRKLSLAKELDILDQDILLKTQQVSQVTEARQLAKVESFSIHGKGVFTGDTLDDVTATGSKTAEEILLIKAQELKVDADTTLTTQKLNESYAAVHKIVADTHVNYGHYTYTNLAAGGIDSVIEKNSSYAGSLSKTQQEIATQQAKGYTYNAWANALTGASSMLGTAIAAEYAEFSPEPTYPTNPHPPGYQLLDIVLTTATNLKDTTTPA